MPEFPQDQMKRVLGGTTSLIFTGAGPHTIPDGQRGFAITVRTQGTIIAALTARDVNQAAATAYAPTGWIGAVLNQGEYLKAGRPLVTITLTAATDSITVWTDQPY